MRNKFKKLVGATLFILFICPILSTWKPATFPNSHKTTINIPEYRPLNDLLPIDAEEK